MSPEGGSSSDYLGAQIPKGFGAMGPGKHPGKIDYAQSVQRS